MRKMFLLPVLVTLIALFLLQVSCSTGRYIEDSEAGVLSSMDQPVEEPSTDVEDTSQSDLFLGGRHNDAGMECNECHVGQTEESDVTTDVCLGCHSDYAEPPAEVAWDFIDPHNSHMVYNDCGECHHAHRQSENQCETCHYLNIQIP